MSEDRGDLQRRSGPPMQPETHDEEQSVRGVRIAELGRPPVVVNLEPDQEISLSELVERGQLTGAAGVEYYVNMHPASLVTRVRNGDAVVAVQRINAGQ